MSLSLLLTDTAGQTHSSARQQYTEIQLVRLDGRLERTLRFGRIVNEHAVAPSRRVLQFRPGAVIALLSRVIDDFGHVRSRIDILQTLAHTGSGTMLPFVRPGADVLLSLARCELVSQVLDAIRAMEHAGIDPCDAAPDHWRYLHQRIGTGQAVRAYTPERHCAWLKRKAIES